MNRSDVLVIGGGPAGSMIAGLTATTGAKVTLLEKEVFPRDKVCGEFLSAEGCAVLERHGLLSRIVARGARRMTTCLLADAKGRSVGSALPDPALGISRAVLDTILLERSREAGVDVHENTPANGIILEEGRVRGVDTPAGPYRAKLVIAADGRRSMIQRALHSGIGDPMTTHARSWFGFAAHFPDRTRGLDGRIELFVFDGGYAGLGPVEDDRLDLALIARVEALRACGNSPQRLFEERIKGNPLLAERLSDSQPVTPWRAVGPLRFGVRQPASHGTMFVGDAAGTIDPFSGEGISNALVAGELALPFVREGVVGGGLSFEVARAWTAAWRAAFAPVTRRTTILGQVFRHPRPAALALRLLQLPGGARMLPTLVAMSRTAT